MKKNQKLIIAIAAGTAVVGMAAFLLGTEKGRKITKQLKGKNLTNKAETILNQARQKLSSIREEFTTACKANNEAVES